MFTPKYYAIYLSYYSYDIIYIFVIELLKVLSNFYFDFFISGNRSYLKNRVNIGLKYFETRIIISSNLFIA